MLSLLNYLVRSSRLHARLLAIFIVIVPGISPASSGYVKGQIEYVRTHDASTYPQWAPPQFWFTLKGISQAGNCPKWANSKLFVMSDNQALAVILTAQATGQEIAAYFDDTHLINGWCAPAFITIGSPAPAY